MCVVRTIVTPAVSRSSCTYCDNSRRAPGSSPVEASSGKVVRHRLNRGGNREANSALWRIVLVRLRSDPRTRAYLERRRAEGRSTREVMRCLKRYVAREVYGAIQRDLGMRKARTDIGDDSYDQRGRPNPDGRLFGAVTTGPEKQDTPAGLRECKEVLVCP